MKLVFGLSIDFQNGMSWPHCTKTQTSLGPSEWASPTQQYNLFAEQTLKFSVYFMQWIKSYYIFTARQTDRRTFSIPVCMGKIFFYMHSSFKSRLRPLCYAKNNSQTIISAQTYSRREEGLLEQLQVDWKLAQSAAQRENERSATWRRRLEGDVRSGIAKEKSSHWTFDAGEWVTRISENKTFYLLRYSTIHSNK